MPEPSHLPVELFDRVIGYATEGRSEFRILCNFSLVSRKLYAALNARIYSRWLYDGEHHSISSLWKFLRSILCSRRIADRVHGLNIRNWTFGLVHGHSRLIFSEDNLELVRNAIRTARLQRMETSIMEALRKTDPRPLMALLLANLRNLTTLYAHLPETDIFLAEVLRKAIEGRRDKSQNEYPPLNSLREAHLTSAWNYRKDWRARDEYKLELHHLWPVFQLPNIQRLSVFDFESLGASNRFGNSFKTSTITDLTLVHYDDSLLAGPDTLALLTLPKTLTILSIYLNDCDLLRNCNQLSNADLWKGIGQHEDSIEHLDIYRDRTGCAPPVHSANNSHFGSMQGFKRLERLYIQPEVLLGGYCGDDLAPFRLRDTLPPNLKSLTVYGDEGMAQNKALGRQLQDVVTSTNFPRLSRVILEMTSDDIGCYTDPADPPHDEVERACRESGIEFETKHAFSLTKGGIGRRYY
ncbi:hypothetical protein K469DRAFT_771533 [Zopfia rhizophila CBS 207.26]|uniref:F-box domain-containing protein n=1 Tax=Zopfia rhizophila CBS 207.26 TaxID=1314779 RepID=A0A6A6D9R2_9PEZI|nr:hypothetical protein K469DRAFT_771533 [Zopfia rhizophila CBS 207.26]